MTSTTTRRVFRCNACPAEYPNPIARNTHARQEHPGLSPAAPKWLRSGKPRPKRPSLKRASDVWPGRP
jgi:hypothetical protein